jgi:hypothetical protein
VEGGKRFRERVDELRARPYDEKRVVSGIGRDSLMMPGF